MVSPSNGAMMFMRVGSHVMAHDNHTGEELLLDELITAHVEKQVNFN